MCYGERFERFKLQLYCWKRDVLCWERENSIFEKFILFSQSFSVGSHVDEKVNQILLCCGNFQFDGGQDFVINNVIPNRHDRVLIHISLTFTFAKFFCPTEHGTTWWMLIKICVSYNKILMNFPQKLVIALLRKSWKLFYF
jgi:hypothetical protein